LELLLEGRLTGKPEGVTKEEVNIKNISSRKPYLSWKTS
jgi:hypothetical protein